MEWVKFRQADKAGILAEDRSRLAEKTERKKAEDQTNADSRNTKSAQIKAEYLWKKTEDNKSQHGHIP